MTKWFLEDNSSANRTPRRIQLLQNLWKQERRNRQIVQRMLRRAEILTQLGKSCRIPIVAIDVFQFGTQSRKAFGI